MNNGKIDKQLQQFRNFLNIMYTYTSDSDGWVVSYTSKQRLAAAIQ
jgi:hypothetical protein